MHRSIRCCHRETQTTHIQSGKLMNSTCACATTLAQKMEALKEKHRYFMQFSLKDDCVHVSTVLSLSRFVCAFFLSFACSIFLREWLFSFTLYIWSSSSFVHLPYNFNMLVALCYHCFFCFLFVVVAFSLCAAIYYYYYHFSVAICLQFTTRVVCSFKFTQSTIFDWSVKNLKQLCNAMLYFAKHFFVPLTSIIVKYISSSDDMLFNRRKKCT